MNDKEVQALYKSVSARVPRFARAYAKSHNIHPSNELVFICNLKVCVNGFLHNAGLKLSSYADDEHILYEYVVVFDKPVADDDFISFDDVEDIRSAIDEFFVIRRCVRCLDTELIGIFYKDDLLCVDCETIMLAKPN